VTNLESWGGPLTSEQLRAQPSPSVQFAGFRENVLEREWDPFSLNSTQATGVSVPTGASPTTIAQPTLPLIAGKAVYVDQITISSDQPGLFAVSHPLMTVQSPDTTPRSGFGAANGSGATSVILPAFGRHTFDMKRFVRHDYDPTFASMTWTYNCQNNLTAGSVLVKGAIHITGFRGSADFDWGAPKVAMFVGDSVLDSFAITEISTMYPFVFKQYLASQGYRTRIVLKSTGGTTSTLQEAARKNGRYDIDKCDLIVYALGINDVGVDAGASYVGNVTSFWNWAKFRYPSAKMLVCGITPLANAGNEAIAATMRSNIQAWVTGVNEARLRYINLGTSLNPADAALLPDGVHPSDSGHAAIGATLAAGWASLGWRL
jgi:lysophospholipase L1-like esterase